MPARPKSLEEAFNSNVTPLAVHECWIWQGSFMRTGYGQVEVREGERRKQWLAHRLSYWLETGELPEQVHHKCHVKACVNPAHLEGLSLVEHQHTHHVKPFCIRGHSMTDPENIYIRPDGKGRRCQACHRIRARKPKPITV